MSNSLSIVGMRLWQLIPVVSVLVGSRPRAEPAAPEAPQGRFVPDAARARQKFLAAAEDYVRRKSDAERGWLYSKPYDPSPGNAGFFSELYQALNLLEAMRITPRGRVLEVGSGPGWLTEILARLRFEVVAVEPSTEMIGIARERLAAAARHCPGEPLEVSFVPQAVEDCELPAGAFDAVVFHESLHHVLDERKTLEVCFAALRDGGVLGISEWAWRPGETALERQLTAEMDRFGTLESPYQPEYLDQILGEAGFSEIRRYHAINGFFEAALGERSIQELAQGHAASTNNVTARKPSPLGPTSADSPGRTRGSVTVLEQSRAGEGGIALKLRIVNTGETAWLARAPRAGFVSLGLRIRARAGEGVEEAAPRVVFDQPVAPGQACEMEARFLPFSTAAGPDLEVGLVLEGIAWLDTAAVPRL